jgi:hypothetical protein
MYPLRWYRFSVKILNRYSPLYPIISSKPNLKILDSGQRGTSRSFFWLCRVYKLFQMEVEYPSRMRRSSGKKSGDVSTVTMV